MDSINQDNLLLASFLDAASFERYHNHQNTKFIQKWVSIY